MKCYTEITNRRSVTALVRQVFGAKKGARMPSDKNRVTVLVDDDLAQQLYDFRFSRRYESQGAAVRDLISAGLRSFEEELGKSAKDDGDER